VRDAKDRTYPDVKSTGEGKEGGRCSELGVSASKFLGKEKGERGVETATQNHKDTKKKKKKSNQKNKKQKPQKQQTQTKKKKTKEPTTKQTKKKKKKKRKQKKKTKNKKKEIKETILIAEGGGWGVPLENGPGRRWPKGGRK